MSFQETISAVIEKYGEQIVVTPLDSETYSEDTGWTSVDGTSKTIYAVPYEVFTGRVQFIQAGNNNTADTQLIIKGTDSVSEKDTFVYRSKTFRITSVNPLPLEGTDLAQVIQATQMLD